MSRPTIQALPIQFTGDRRIDASSQSIASTNRALSTTAIFTGRLIEGVAFIGTAPVDVAHGLGRPHRGWIITRQLGNRTGLIELPIPLTDPLSSLVVRLDNQLSLDATVDLWVF